MTTRIVHHDLIDLPQSNGVMALYWLRILDRGGTTVVIVTEVLGNPGHSAVNEVEAVCESISRRFTLGDSVCWITATAPMLDFDKEETFSRVSFTRRFENPAWTRIARRGVNRLAGTRLPPLPDDLTDRVLAAGGVLEQPERLTHLVIDTADLPLPHNLFQCAHADLFRALLDGHEDHRDAAISFFESLTGEDRAACRYHQADWKQAADRAVSIIERLGPQPATDDFFDAVESSGLSDRDQRAAASLLGASGICIGDGQGYINGQHRGCALRFSGASRVVVVE